MKRTICNDDGIFVSEEPLTSANVEEIKRQWHNRYAMTKIKKSTEFDSWWIKFKKWGKWIVIALMLAALVISFEYCRKQYNTQFRKKIAIEMLFMKHRWEHHIDRDLTN